MASDYVVRLGGAPSMPAPERIRFEAGNAVEPERILGGPNGVRAAWVEQRPLYEMHEGPAA